MPKTPKCPVCGSENTILVGVGSGDCYVMCLDCGRAVEIEDKK